MTFGEPSDIIAAVPSLLGYQPQNATAIVFLDRRSRPLMALGVAHDDEPESVAESIGTFSRTMRSMGAVGAALVAFAAAPSPKPLLLLDRLANSLRRAGLSVAFTAESDAGARVGGPSSAALPAPRVRPSCERMLPGVTQEQCVQELMRLLTLPGERGARDVAKSAQCATDYATRDLLLWEILHLEGRPQRQVQVTLVASLAHVPADVLPALASIAAVVCTANGDPEMGLGLLTHALAADPEYPLARTLLSACVSGLPTELLKEVILTIPREHLN